MSEDRMGRRDLDADETAFLDESRPFATAMRARFGGCPPPAAIRARGLDVMPPEAAARLDAHLASCRACQALAEAFSVAQDESDEIAAAQDETDEVPRDEIWRRVAHAREAPRPHARAWPRLMPYAVAASLALIAGVLTMTVVRLQDENRRLSDASERDRAAANARVATLETQVADLRLRGNQPPAHVNVPIVDLAADATRGTPSTRTIALARDAQAVVFVLTVPAAARAPSYALEITDAEGRVRLQLPDVRATPERTINLVLPRSTVPDGQLRLVLSAVRNERQERVAEYSVRVTTG